MLKDLSRRCVLKVFALGSLLNFTGRRSAGALQEERGSGQRIDSWDKTNDRVWLGGDFWVNPMEDWRLAEGWAQCQTSGANRSIHCITRQITEPDRLFELVVEMRRPKDLKHDKGGGFRIGIRADINEHRANCFAGGGIDAGLAGNKLVLGKQHRQLDQQVDTKSVTLRLTGAPEGTSTLLTLQVFATESQDALGSISLKVPRADVVGNMALVSQFAGPQGRPRIEGYGFQNWRTSGGAVTVHPDRRFGPILWSMYSLSDSRSEEGFVLKMSALTGPLGTDDDQSIKLFVRRGGEWESLGEAALDSEAWVATFRIPNWNEKIQTPYRLVYEEKLRDGSRMPQEWSGVIKSNPAGRPLRLAALTCQKDYAFPYEPVANNLIKLDPDMLFFAGDQLYEDHGGFGLIREPAERAILNYLRKYYQFGWSFREAMRNAPTVCIPDDHDVFQGNIWGEGGAPMASDATGTSFHGGYREPARMVNVVHKTNCAHHPDFFDPTPIEQGISVYYGDMVYGGVSFAILGDRQWKSGPGRLDTGEDRPDHISDPNSAVAALDKPGLVFLGERQEDFLRQWGDDWRGHTMKVLLSQTVFAGLATHHGSRDRYLKADLDSGAWPQSPRNRAIDILRSSKALHINGDQHLTSLSQYGVRDHRDSNWSFCTPAIAAGYPRWWLPDEVGMPHENRPAHGLPNTGEYFDGLGNKVYVYAIGNPEVGTKKNRYELAHQKGSGLGLVTINTEKKTYTIESFRFLVDATSGKPEDQFPGWPVTLYQRENAGKNVID